MSIKTLSSREVYRNAWLRLREDEVERSNGARGIYGVVDKDDCAIILPIQGETIYLIEQFRYTVQERCLELPQGGLGDRRCRSRGTGAGRTAGRNGPDRRTA